MRPVIVLGADAAYNGEPLATKKKGGACVAIYDAVLHQLHCREQCRTRRRRNVNDLVVPRYGADVVLGPIHIKKACFFNGLNLPWVNQRRNNPNRGFFCLGEIEEAHGAFVTKANQFRAAVQGTNKIKAATHGESGGRNRLHVTWICYIEYRKTCTLLLLHIKVCGAGII